MRLASVRHSSAGPVWGLIEQDALIPLSTVWGDIEAALAAGPRAIGEAAAAQAARLALDGCEWLPPVPRPGKILCVGLNYKNHAAEARRELPQHPSLFPRFADSFVGHGVAVTRPWISEKFDFEGELAVVIGRGGRHIARERALEHVAGYTCLAENSVRDFQKHNAQVTPGKNFAGSGAMGPWLVTADEIPDPAALSLCTYLNGERMQDGRLADLIFPIPELIAYISIFTALAPGDVIATGTPEGVGSARKPPLFMRAGDVLEVDIPGIGRLRNPVVDEPRAAVAGYRP
jgi:2-keto-4-pentenoate hydratase/2-oxohepta-3-ene-1,7-dioic acid hydratase in catechol pathway